MVNPSDHVETPARDSPPHLTGKSVFGVPKLELSEELSTVSKPLYEDELPETLHIAPYRSDLIPGSFAFCHINQMAAKAQILACFPSVWRMCNHSYHEDISSQRPRKIQ